MANSIALITKYYAEAWDEVYKMEAISSVLDGNKKLIKTFEGTKTVKIYKPMLDGLSDYKRANNPINDGNDYSGFTSASNGGYGYVQSDASGEWEEFTMRIDRGAQYRIALFDDEETQGLAVGTTVKEVNRVIVSPEVDAYAFSEIAAMAGTVAEEVIGDGTNSTVKPLHALNTAYKALFDLEVPVERQLVFVSSDFDLALQETNELYRKLDQVEYKKDVAFTIKKYNGREIIVVPPQRFKTLISLNTKGYGWKVGSQAINFLVVDKEAVYHVVKYDKLKVFSPEVVQDYDGYKINVRIYHDVFVPSNKRFGIYASLDTTAASAAQGLRGTIANYYFNATDNTIHDLAFAPAEHKVDFYVISKAGTTAETVTLGTALSTYSTAVKVANGSVIATPSATTTYVVAAAKNGVIVGVSKKTFAITVA